jgi:hypothetical protein
MPISMAEFQPIFGPLSFLTGALLGVFIGTLFALLFGALRFRSFPVDQVERTAKNSFWVALPAIVSFIIFRMMFGLYEFHPGLSVWHFFLEFVLLRTHILVGGILFGLLITLIFFLESIARGVFAPAQSHAVEVHFFGHLAPKPPHAP